MYFALHLSDMSTNLCDSIRDTSTISVNIVFLQQDGPDQTNKYEEVVMVWCGVVWFDAGDVVIIYGSTRSEIGGRKVA